MKADTRAYCSNLPLQLRGSWQFTAGSLSRPALSPGGLSHQLSARGAACTRGLATEGRETQSSHLVSGSEDHPRRAPCVWQGPRPAVTESPLSLCALRLSWVPPGGLLLSTLPANLLQANLHCGVHFPGNWPQTVDTANGPRKQTLREMSGTSLLVQWLRLRLPMQGEQVWSLVRELNSTYFAAKKLKHKAGVILQHVINSIKTLLKNLLKTQWDFRAWDVQTC